MQDAIAAAKSAYISSATAAESASEIALPIAASANANLIQAASSSLWLATANAAQAWTATAANAWSSYTIAKSAASNVLVLAEVGVWNFMFKWSLGRILLGLQRSLLPKRLSTTPSLKQAWRGWKPKQAHRLTLVHLHRLPQQLGRLRKQQRR
jgi:hypothetical protein